MINRQTTTYIELLSAAKNTDLGRVGGLSSGPGGAASAGLQLPSSPHSEEAVTRAPAAFLQEGHLYCACGVGVLNHATYDVVQRVPAGMSWRYGLLAPQSHLTSSGPRTCSLGQYSTVQYSTLQYSTVQHSTALTCSLGQGLGWVWSSHCPGAELQSASEEHGGSWRGGRA